MSKTILTPQRIKFLESLAQRISQALYSQTVKPIGTNGSVSVGLLHDDYDKLREIANEAKLEDWERRYPNG